MIVGMREKIRELENKNAATVGIIRGLWETGRGREGYGNRTEREKQGVHSSRLLYT